MKPIDMSFEFKHLQFPMRLAVAMTTQPCMGFANKMSPDVSEGILLSIFERKRVETPKNSVFGHLVN